MTMANYRIRSPGMSYEQEFEHHGVEGQKWGVITRNVGVNYVPIGNSGASNKGGGNAPKGTNSFTAGLKRMKEEHDARQAAKPLNLRKLNKRQIARLSNEELQQAIARASAEEKLLKSLHPELFTNQGGGNKAGQNFVLQFLKDVGYDTAKAVGKGFVKDKLTDFIMNNKDLSGQDKIRMLENYGLAVPLLAQLNNEITKGNEIARALNANKNDLLRRYGEGNDREYADLANNIAQAIVAKKYGIKIGDNGKNGGKNGGKNDGKIDMDALVNAITKGNRDSLNSFAETMWNLNHPNADIDPNDAGAYI